MLHALKEVILHLPSDQLEKLADQLWNPLFDESDGAAAGRTKRTAPAAGGADIGDDGIRNVKAACIGKLTMTAPGKYLPQLQVCEKVKDDRTRADHAANDWVFLPKQGDRRCRRQVHLYRHFIVVR